MKNVIKVNGVSTINELKQNESFMKAIELTGYALVQKDDVTVLFIANNSRVSIQNLKFDAIQSIEL